MPCPFMFSIYSANTARTAVLGLLTLLNPPRLLFRQQGGDSLKSQEENMTETFEMCELMAKRSRRSWPCPGVPLGLCVGPWFVSPLSPAGLRGAGRGSDIRNAECSPWRDRGVRGAGSRQLASGCVCRNSKAMLLSDSKSMPL